MLGQIIACPQTLMAESTDYYFLRPSKLLSAKRIDFIDAINLVVYAELPLVTAHRGKDLIAGFLRRDAFGNFTLLGPSGADEMIRKYACYIDSLSYPVSPTQYESILETMCKASETTLPYFFHEHHLMVDRRRRAAMFFRLHKKLRDELSTQVVKIQVKEADLTSFLSPGSSMTRDELRDYLFYKDVLEWWDDEENVKSHAFIERVTLSDSTALTNDGSLPRQNVTNRFRRWVQTTEFEPEYERYDELQLPSLLLAQKLLRQSPFRQLEHHIQAAFYTPESHQLNPLEVPIAPAERVQGPEPDVTTSAPLEQEAAQENVATLPLPVRAPSHSAELELGCIGALSRKGQASNEEPPGVNRQESKDDPLLSKADVAELFRVSEGTVDNYRKKFPDFPKASMLDSTTLRWTKSEIQGWIDSRPKPK